VDEGVDIRNITKESSYFSVFDVFLSYLVPIDSEDSANGSVMEGCEFSEIIFRQVPRFTSPKEGIEWPRYVDL
jgi:hypothetical protein